MVSQQNTLALFRRFLASFSVAPKRARDNVDEPMDDADEDLEMGGGREHQFYDVAKLRPPLSLNTVGTFMLKVFRLYLERLEMLRDATFTCTIDSKVYQISFTHEEVQALSSFFCFACNACMHEKMFKDRDT